MDSGLLIKVDTASEVGVCLCRCRINWRFRNAVEPLSIRLHFPKKVESSDPVPL